MPTFNVVTTSTYDQTGTENGCFLLVVDEKGHIVNVPGIKKVKGLGKFYNTNKFLGPDGNLYCANWQQDKFTSAQIAKVKQIVATTKVTSPKRAPIKLIASGKLGGPFRFDELSLLTSEFATLDAVVRKLEPATPTTAKTSDDVRMQMMTPVVPAAAPAPVAAAAPAPVAAVASTATKSRMWADDTSDEEEEDESKDSTITEFCNWGSSSDDDEEEEEEATAIVDAPAPFAKTSWANIVAAAPVAATAAAAPVAATAAAATQDALEFFA